MKRRNFIKGLIAFGACPICAEAGFAGADGRWSYSGEDGPEHWGEIGEESQVCGTGAQQSPLDIVDAVKAELPPISIHWKNGGGRMINTGHTIQINMPAGSKLIRGDREYELKQFHFHAPSEHHVEGRALPMEVHFVHKDVGSDALGVLAVFLTPGAPNTTFRNFAASFPSKGGVEICVKDVDPNGLLPSSLSYWAYEGSLTTPPCSENVDWMIAMEPVEVGAEDIAKFTALYPMNARPVLSANRRFILSSH